MPKSKGPKKPAAAAPQPNPDEQPKLPRVWSICFYSEAELQLAALALGVLEMGVVEGADHPIDVLQRAMLQDVSLQATTDLVAQNGGRDWVQNVRRRFSDLVKEMKDEEDGG